MHTSKDISTIYNDRAILRVNTRNCQGGTNFSVTLDYNYIGNVVFMSSSVYSCPVLKAKWRIVALSLPVYKIVWDLSLSFVSCRMINVKSSMRSTRRFMHSRTRSKATMCDHDLDCAKAMPQWNYFHCVGGLMSLCHCSAYNMSIIYAARQP